MGGDTMRPPRATAPHAGGLNLSFQRGAAEPCNKRADVGGSHERSCRQICPPPVAAYHEAGRFSPRGPLGIGSSVVLENYVDVGKPLAATRWRWEF